MNARRIVLAAALAITLAAVFWPPEATQEVATVEAVRRTASAVPADVKEQAAASAAQTVHVAADAGREPAAPRFTPEMAGDLFPVQTWVPPPPPPPKPPPPPPPEPPPLPFKYLGRWTEAGVEVLFLSHGNRMLRISNGDELPGGWKVDEIARNRVVFTYLPLNMQKTLGIAP